MDSLSLSASPRASHPCPSLILGFGILFLALVPPQVATQSSLSGYSPKWPAASPQLPVVTVKNRLLSVLFEYRDYDKSLRAIPVQSTRSEVNNGSAAVQVQIGLALMNVLEMKEWERFFTAKVMMRLAWTDTRLKWSGAEFGRVRLLRIPSTWVWTPDIVLRNTADDRSKIPKHDIVLLMVNPNGEVFWSQMMTWKADCLFDISKYPFDQQTCKLEFESSSFNSEEVNLNLYSGPELIDLTHYSKSDNWKIVEALPILSSYAPSLRSNVVTFYVTLRRRFTPEILGLVTFSVLVALMSLLSLLFAYGSPESMVLTLGSTIGAMVLIIYMQLTALPSKTRLWPGREVPLTYTATILEYLQTILAVNSCSLVMNVGGRVLSEKFRGYLTKLRAKVHARAEATWILKSETVESVLTIVWAVIMVSVPIFYLMPPAFWFRRIALDEDQFIQESVDAWTALRKI